MARSRAGVVQWQNTSLPSWLSRVRIPSPALPRLLAFPAPPERPRRSGQVPLLGLVSLSEGEESRGGERGVRRPEARRVEPWGLVVRAARGRSGISGRRTESRGDRRGMRDGGRTKNYSTLFRQVGEKSRFCVGVFFVF